MKRPLPLATLPVVGLVLVLLCSAASGQTTSSPFTTVVVFGDSLSDTGNVAHVTHSDFGVRYPGPLFNYTDGRFTDGPDTTPPIGMYPGAIQNVGVWHEQLVKMLPGLAAAKNSLDGGLNYAYGAATTQDGTSVVSQGGQSITVENMGQQVTDYLTRPGKTPDPKALYILWGGGDDLFSDATPTNLVAAPARLAALAGRLAEAGAVNILVPNLPPLGSTPAYVGQPTVIAELDAATVFYNAQLSADLDALQASLDAAGLHVHIYRLDIFTLYAAIAVDPAAYGFTDIIDAAQGKSTVNPDFYVFWDDVHPTTTGHHDIAEAAYSLMIPKVTLTVTPPSPEAVGTSVTFTAVVTSQPPSPAPTGTVTFVDTSTNPWMTLGTGTLDGTGTATFTSSAIPAGTYSLVASYDGDAGNQASTSAAQSVMVVAPSATTLVLSNLSVNQGGSVTFTATVTGAAGTPTGTVAFLDGTTALGSGTLDGSGVATYSTTMLGAGTHPISAEYGGDVKHSGSTSASQTLTVLAPSITFSASPTSVVIPRGGTGTTTITAKPAGGFSGAVNFSCGKLPAFASCIFSPTSLNLPGTNATATTILTISTRPASSAALRPSNIGPRGQTSARLYAVFAVVPWLGLAGLAALPGRRSKGRKGLTLLLLAASSLAAVAGLSSCASGSKKTPPGTYSVPVTITASGTTTTLTLQVTVQ